MKKIILNSIILTAVISVFTFCTSGNDPADGNEGDIINDSLAQIISPEELQEGKLIYKNKCQKCHQKDGKGIEGAFPSLVDNESDLNSVINGVEGTTMIAFKDELSDFELVLVMNFINNSWGKDFGRTKIEEISKLK